jgi:hypothetical protein
MKLLIMQFSPTFYHFIPLWSIYYPQHHILKYPQTIYFPQCRRPSFTPMQNYKQNNSFVYSNFYIFRQQIGIQEVLNWMVLIVFVVHTHWQPGLHQQNTYVCKKQKAEHKKEECHDMIHHSATFWKRFQNF